MYKLIATDMDGTLLDDKKNIGEKNLKAIIKAQEKNVTFVLASGRVEKAMLPFAKELKMDKYKGYVLAYNGAKIIDCSTNETVFFEGIKRAEIEYLIEISKRFNIALVTYIDSNLYYNFEHEYVDIEERITTFKKKKYDSIDDIKVLEVGKCMFIGDIDKIANLLAYLQENDSDKFHTTLSDPHFLEVLNLKVSKGKSLKRLANMLGIDIKETIACGDSYNDTDMLETVALKVAAKNGVDKIKEIANYISVTNNEGVLADVIDKFI